jgi:hypothetical protein
MKSSKVLPLRAVCCIAQDVSLQRRKWATILQHIAYKSVPIAASDELNGSFEQGCRRSDWTCTIRRGKELVARGGHRRLSMHNATDVRKKDLVWSFVHA